jgi:tetratricopeptide (TPR) repeat protein
MKQVEQEALYLKVSNQLRKEKKFDEAIHSSKHILQLNPNSVPALTQLSEIYELIEDYEKAASTYRLLIRTNPQNTVARIRLARILNKQGNIQEAITIYQKALVFPKPPIEAYLCLIEALEKAGQSDNATSIYRYFLSKSAHPLLLWNIQLIYIGISFLSQIKNKFLRSFANIKVSLRRDRNEIYLKLWKSLNESTLEQLYKDFSNYPKIFDQYEIIKYFKLKSKYRSINSACLTNTDIQYIENIGLSHSYLELNKLSSLDKLSFNQEETRNSASTTNLFIANQKHQFQFTTIKDKCVYAICPWTGATLNSNCSFVTRNLNSQYIFYRFIGKEVFYVATGRQWLGFPKVCIYFPKTDFIYFFDHHYFREEDEITDLKIHLVSNWHTVSLYIAKDQDKKVAVLVNWDHFAHSLWNELSGINELIENKLLESSENFLFAVIAEPLGAIKDIFPEISSRNLKRITENQLKKDIFENNYFITRIGSNFIKEDLVKRIYKVANKQCSISFKQEVEEARKKHFPLLWVSIRLGVRTWISQTEGITKIISELHKDFPDLGVVIDGYSLNNGFDSSPFLIEHIKEETKVVNNIRSSLSSNINIYDTIGCMLCQSIVWANAVDFYITHHGTIQHKIGWFANKPGIVHSNTYVISNEKKYYSNPNLGLPAAGVRENCLLPYYINEKYVSDITDGIQKQAEERRTDLDNYDFDWNILYNEALKVARSLH